MSRLIGVDDLAQMRRDLLDVRADNETAVVLRRGDSSLAAQSVRVVTAGGRGFRAASGEGAERRMDVIILGGVDFDVAVDDRFTSGGVLYRISFVRPNRTARVIAEGVAVE